MATIALGGATSTNFIVLKEETLLNNFGRLALTCAVGISLGGLNIYFFKRNRAFEDMLRKTNTDTNTLEKIRPSKVKPFSKLYQEFQRTRKPKNNEIEGKPYKPLFNSVSAANWTVGIITAIAISIQIGKIYNAEPIVEPSNSEINSPAIASQREPLSYQMGP